MRETYMREIYIYIYIREKDMIDKLTNERETVRKTDRWTDGRTSRRTHM